MNRKISLWAAVRATMHCFRSSLYATALFNRIVHHIELCLHNLHRLPDFKQILMELLIKNKFIVHMRKTLL